MSDTTQLPRRRFQWKAALTSIALGLAVAATALGPARVQARLAAESHDLLTMEYQQVGTTEEEAVRLACIRAVRATVGRLLFSEYSLQARDLLEPYLQIHWQKFVASQYVLERRADRDGFGVRIRVQTYPEVLFRDLREKKFLYLPKPEPYYTVFLAELDNGQPVSVSTGRDGVLDALQEAGARVFRDAPANAPANLAALGSAASLAAAREAATRQGAEIIVAGTASSAQVKSGEIFYDQIFTVETALKLAFIRTDDGVVLGETEVVQRASETEADAARTSSVRAAVDAAMRQLYAAVASDWQVKDRGKARYELMFTYLIPDEVDLVSRHLETQLAHGTKAELVSHFGDVAIIALDTPRDYSVVQRAVLDFKPFDMRITDRQGRRITVEVRY